MLEGELPGYFFIRENYITNQVKDWLYLKKSHGLQPQKAAQQQFEEFVCKKKKKKSKFLFQKW